MTITIEVDGNIVEFPDAETAAQYMRGRQATPADVPGMADALSTQRAAQGTHTAPNQPQAPPRSIGETIYQNVIGRGEIDTPGEQLGAMIGDFVTSVPGGVARGAAEVVGLPGTADDLISAGINRLVPGALPSVEGMRDGSPFSGAALRELMSNATGGATDWQADSRAGQYGGTVGEFLPGAGGAGARGLLAYGVAPGVASEVAGQLTEGTPLEPYARTAAAIATPFLSGPMSGLGNIPRGGSAEQQRLAGILRDNGVTPTAGQSTNSGMLRRLEGTVSPRPSQLEDLSAAAMRTTGSTARTVNPTTLTAARSAIGQEMDDILGGVSFSPSTAIATRADDIVTNYLEMAPGMTVVPRIRGIANEIIDRATSPNAAPVDLTQLRVWRTTLGRLSQGADEATTSAAHELRMLIDEATDTALASAGRGADVQALAASRERWRNYLAISDASTRAGTEGGVMTAANLEQAVIRTQGRQNFAHGTGTDLMELARAGGEVLRPMPTVSAGGVRGIRGAEQLSAAGLGGAMGFNVGGWPGAMVGGGLGLLAPPAGQAAMRSRTVQSLINNPALSAAVAARTTPGLLAGR